MKLATLTILLGLVITTSINAKETLWKPNFQDKDIPVPNLVLINQAILKTTAVKAEQPRKVLIFSGTSGFRHSSISTGKYALKQLGLKTKAFDALVSDDPDNFLPEKLNTFNTVILLNSTGDFFMPPTRKKQSIRNQFTDAQWTELQARHNRLIDNLLAYVKQGGGLVGLHAATDACYQNAAYGEMIGGFFNGHPWKSQSIVNLDIEDQNHTLNKQVFAGMTDFEIQDEIYQFKNTPYSREKLRILLSLNPNKSINKPQPKSPKLKREDGDYPVAWIQEFGQGRVFYSSLGHREETYWNPLIMNHFLAGIQYALGDIKADTTPSALVK